MRVRTREFSQPEGNRSFKLFYNSFAENVLTLSFICWFYNLNTNQRNSLQRIVNFSSNIICDQVRTLSLFRDQRILHKVESILRDPEHVLRHVLSLR